MGAIIYKSVETQLEEIDSKEGVVTLVASAWSLDSHGDTIQRGAYARTIRERGPQGQNRIKHLWQHDSWEPIGMPLELTEEARGLMIKSQLAATQRGKEALLLYEMDAWEHSVGIDIITYEVTQQPEQGNGWTRTRTLKDLELWEYSSVTWGANKDTPTVDVKNLEGLQLELDRYSAKLENIRKAIKADITQETADQLRLSVDYLEHLLTRTDQTLKALTQEGLQEPLGEQEWARVLSSELGNLKTYFMP